MDGPSGEVPIADMLDLLGQVSLPVLLGLVNAATGGTGDVPTDSRVYASAAPPLEAPVSSRGIGAPVVGGVLGVASLLAGTAYTLRRVIPGAVAVLAYGSEEDADPDVREGRKLIEQGHYSEAIECFNRAIDRNPEHKHAYNNRAVAYFYLGMYEPCITDCDSQIEAYPGSVVEALCNKAMALEELERFEDAIEAWSDAAAEAASQGKPEAKRADVYNRRGQLRVKLGDFREAVQDFEKGLALHDTCEGYAGRADAELREGAAMDADGLHNVLQDIQRAVELNPHNADYYCIMGRAYASSGDEEDLEHACEAFTTAVELDDTLCDAFLNRAHVHRTCGRVDEALRDLSRAGTLDPSNLMVHINRADIISTNAADMPAHMRAVQEVNRAIEKDPHHWLAYNTRGTIYHRLLRRTEAVNDYNKAIMLLVEQGGAGTQEHTMLMQNMERAMGSS
eukprot:TRINITY_DN14178_c0_g1_i2.p2 TRINITY_DN14178_c0_g1~~TRINITY_DN14178_c0_g1_i2.p2  ORF type:complete len:476 (+),score=182.97 TRINITY_DN14178_c0_g1_i2:76-1428(+)